ncbi:DNA-binding protein ['Osedax' symbiont bacterium Rs2_46_30_T18]|nr:DNA-binding protein ['Osedax' symbiont bacterium Rs2_46_30_T18]
MTDFVRILTRKNSLRKQCQELSTEDITKIIADLTNILDEHKEQERARSKAEQVKIEKIEAIRQAMAESGIAFEDLKELVPSAPKKKVQAKYRVVVDNITHEWSGRGRTPVVFQQYFDANSCSKESCLIK